MHGDPVKSIRIERSVVGIVGTLYKSLKPIPRLIESVLGQNNIGAVSKRIS